MLKAELHTHVRGDFKDRISYTARNLIDKAAELNYDVLGITNHNRVYSEEGIKEYALSKNIILLLGIELEIEGKHTLIYNITTEQAMEINHFRDLARLKMEHSEILVIAPHPFHYGNYCLKRNILRYLSLFDAWEYSFFYSKICNPNKRTINLAKRLHKPMVGCSDVHRLENLEQTYTLIAAEEFSEKAIIEAIKKGNTQVVTKPLPLFKFINIGTKAVLSIIKRMI